MALKAVDTAKSAFGSLTQPVGLKVIGLLFVVQLANMLGSMAYTAGTVAALLGALVSVLAAVATLIIMVGALRSFDSGAFSKEHYTNNLVWPVTRSVGANAVTSIFAYGLSLLAVLPFIVVAGLVGAGIGASPATAVLGLIGGVFGLGVLIYVLLTLSISIPMIATGDRRMFEALDQSVQRTGGEKKSLFLAFLPLGAVYLAVVAVLVALAPAQGTVDPLFGAASALISSTVAAAFFSLLTEFDDRLPEA